MIFQLIKLRHLSLYFLLFFGTLYGYACNCPSYDIKKAKANSIKNSDFIFIGDVFEVDTVQQLYKIKILEVFKGKLGNIVVGTPKQDAINYSTCSFWPNLASGSEFIFYAKKVNGTDQIYVDQCSATRSITNPQIHLSYFFGKYEKMQGFMTKEMSFEEKMKFIEVNNRLKQLAYRDLREELEILDKLRRRR